MVNVDPRQVGQLLQAFKCSNCSNCFSGCLEGPCCGEDPRVNRRGSRYNCRLHPLHRRRQVGVECVNDEYQMMIWLYCCHGGMKSVPQCTPTDPWPPPLHRSDEDMFVAIETARKVCPLGNVKLLLNVLPAGFLISHLPL